MTVYTSYTCVTTVVPQRLVNTAIEKHYAQDLHATNNCSQLKYTQSIENKPASLLLRVC